MNYSERARKITYKYPFLSSLGIHVNFWLLSFTLYALLRHFFIKSLSFLIEIPIRLNLIQELTEIWILAIIYAVILNFIDYRIDRRYSSLSFSWSIILRVIIYFLVFLLMWFIGSTYFQKVVMEDVELPADSFKYQFMALLIYTSISVILFGFISQMNKTYGPGVLIPILFGYYRTPVREYRIFLFADLKSSTTLAEKLGMLKYSSLIQDCFSIANTILPRHDAQVYQYVGDEIVLIWPAYQKHDFLNALNYYFDFTEKLNERSDYFKSEYGALPEFKAGINCGEITAVEVGNIKREIAYHGDNINIAARLEAMASKLNVHVLVSEGFYSQIKETDQYRFDYLDEIQLKGKLKKTRVYTVSQA